MKLANAVSFSRLFVLAGHLALASRLSPQVNMVLALFNLFLDKVDGRVACRFGSTPYGGFMDLSMDRVVDLGYYSYLALAGRLAPWFLLGFLARHIIYDYAMHFQLIEAKATNQDQIIRGVHRWVYSSQLSRVVNSVFKLSVIGGGFLFPIPVWLQGAFLAWTLVRALPAFRAVYMGT